MFTLLARLFSAIGHASQVPTGFMDGVVVSLPNPGGDRLGCSAYRPITLLTVLSITARLPPPRVVRSGGGVR
eukprot:186410-Chlamydomonas_euryale.AAC.1